MGKLTLRALAPDRTVLEQEADFLVLRTVEGELGVLPGHEPCALMLDNGMLRVYEDKKQTASLVVLTGVATVEGDTVTVLSPLMERPDRIEALLADLERQREEKQKQEERSALEIHRAETALRRMLVEQDVSAYSVMRGLDGDGEPDA